MKKLRVSTKIGLAAAILAAGGYFGFQQLTSILIGNAHFEPIAPGRVNIVGITPGRGYRIITANDVAQLVEAPGGDFKGNESDSQGATEGAIKKKIPIKELLGVLRGDGKALGEFVMRMNDMNETEEWPPIRVLWRKADLDKAIAGDQALRKKLESDLNVRLDGTPIRPLNRNSLENGIFLVSPIELTVNIDGKRVAVKGEIMEPYKPSFIKAVESRYKDRSNVDDNVIAGFYGEEAATLEEHPEKRENIAAAIQRLTSAQTMTERLKAPKKLLDSADVVLNETFITDANYDATETSQGKKLYNLRVSLNDEGRKRLWKFSKNRVGSQILLIADNVAIASPRIEHELAFPELTITQMPDEVLVREAVNSIRGSKRVTVR